MSNARLLWILLAVTVSSGWAFQYYEDFSSGSGDWAPDHTAWTIVEGSPGAFAYRGDFSGDSLTQNRSINLAGSWRLEANFQFQRYYNDTGTRAVSGFALFPRVGGGVQLEAHVHRLSSGYDQFDLAWFNTTNRTWNVVLVKSWTPVASSSYRVQLTRLAGSDKLVFKVVSPFGFTYRAETSPIPTSVLNSLPVMGFQVNGSSIDYSQLLVISPFALPPPPVVSSQPQSQTVWESSSVTFNVTATGSSPLTTLTYQWRKDGANLSRATNTTYTIPAVTGDRAGIYSVVVTDGDNITASSDARLTVLPRPALQIETFNQNVALSWPTNALGFNVETTDTFPKGTWSTISSAPTIIGESYTLKIASPETGQIYRLKRL